MLLICNSMPNFRIYNPGSGEYRAFLGGRLEIERDDPDYEVVITEAHRNPAIAIYESATTCPECGEVFAGSAAKRALGAHRKNVHFDRWLADKEADHAQTIQTELKAREGIACDACRPSPQVFPTEDALQEHIAAFHAAAPVVDDDGNTVGAPPA